MPNSQQKFKLGKEIVILSGKQTKFKEPRNVNQFMGFMGGSKCLTKQYQLKTV
jgi:hypothetical protein